MKLIGSVTSPFVRRIRLLLAHRPYDFVNLDIYGQDRDALRRNSPTLKIPALQDGEQSLYDSRVIARYLSQKLQLDPLSWNEENLLTLIDAVNDSFVILLLSKRSGFDVEQDALLFNLQRERLAVSLKELNRLVEEKQFEQWRYPAICLYCMVDWVEFRQLADFSGLEALLAFRDRNREQPMVQETDPRVS